MFDPDVFLKSVAVQGPLSTITIAVDEGDYKAEIKSWELQKPTINPKTNQLGSPALVVQWNVLDDNLRLKFERPEVIVRQTIWLDIDANGGLDTGKGKNVGLGRLREALGINDRPGNPFEGLLGGLAVIKVKQRSDPDDPEQKYADVRKVAKLPS